MKAIDNRLDLLCQRSTAENILDKILSSFPLYEDSLVSNQSFLEELNYLRTQTSAFYAKVQNEEQKIITEFNNALSQFKAHLKTERRLVRCSARTQPRASEGVTVSAHDAACVACD